MADLGQTVEILAAGEEMRGIARSVYEKLAAHQPGRYNYQEVVWTTFANNEFKPRIPETLRNKSVYLFHPMQQPDPNASLVKLLWTLDAIDRASVDQVTLVLPYFSYLRQDRKDEPRTPISARKIADLIELSPKVERVITMDPHTEQSQGFFSISVDLLYGRNMHAAYAREQFGGDYQNLIAIGADIGSEKRTAKFANMLDPNMKRATLKKDRSGPNKSRIVGFAGDDFTGLDALIYDDMIDTAGTVENASKYLLANGARSVTIYATHWIASAQDGKKTPEERLSTSGAKVIAIETIPRSTEYKTQHASWLTLLSPTDLIAQAIEQSAMMGGSISGLDTRLV